MDMHGYAGWRRFYNRVRNTAKASLWKSNWMPKRSIMNGAIIRIRDSKTGKNLRIS